MYMKLAIRTVSFHLLCIVVFSFLYYIYQEDFDGKGDEKKLMDFILLSTTVQAGVGITDLYPATFYSKLIIIIQQMVMITTNIFTIYIFTL
jgi:hypothetical protein